MENTEPLAAELREAERALKSSLEQACSTNVSRADTGELIRIEEMLAIASEAAKKAISIRRRRHEDRREPAPAPPGGRQRRFTDEHGTEWMAWAVQPPGSRTERSAQLLGDFRHGWLAFESAGSKRRLHPIPDGWEDLDDTGLRALLVQAHSVPGRRTDDRKD